MRILLILSLALGLQAQTTVIGVSAITGTQTIGTLILGTETLTGPATGNLFLGGGGAVVTGNFNTGLANQALSGVTSGTFNVAAGVQSLFFVTTTSHNISMGDLAGTYLANGSSPNVTPTGGTYLGDQTRASAAALTNEIVIGASAIGAGSNTAVIGAAVTDVYLGSSTGGGTVHAGGVSLNAPTTTYSVAGTPLPTCASGVLNVIFAVSDATSATAIAYAGSSNVTTMVHCVSVGGAFAWWVL